MSDNQRSDKNHAVQQYRKSGRSASFNQQRTSSGSYGKGGGGAPADSSSFSSSHSRSLKKSSNNNVQGAQSRVNLPPPANPNPPLESSSGPSPARLRSVQNGAAHIQPQQRRSTDAPITRTNAKPAESTTAPQRIGRAVPKAPTSQSSSVNSDLTLPTTPAKAPGDGSKGFAFQFGSISPGFVNGMQLPARTSSAPPNLDEQKRDQVRHDPTKVVSQVPVPPAPPKQELQRKDLISNAESTSGDVHLISKSKKDIQVQSSPAGNQSQKPSVHPVPGMSMQMSYHQPQVPLQFSGSNPQIQSQGMPATSLQVPMPMAMPMPVPNAPQMPQQMFVPGLQPHGMMHQGQALGFAPQMGHQLNQMGNLGIGIAQYPPQQGGKLSTTRRTPVKIVDPGTHQEVRLDNKRAETYSDGGPSRSHPNVPPQSQPISSYPPGHHINYYSNYNGSPIFFPPASSLPLTSTQMTPTSQVPRYNYTVNQSSQNVSVVSPQDPAVSGKTGVSMRPITEPSKQEQGRNAHDVIPSATSAVAPVTVRLATGSVGGSVLETTDKVELPKVSRPSVESTPKDSEACAGGSMMKPKLASNSSAPKLSLTSKQNVASVESPVAPSMGSLEASVMALLPAEGRRETLSRLNSMKDRGKKQGPRGSIQSIQVSEEAASSLPSETLNSRALEGQDSRPSTIPTTEISGSVSKSAGESLPVPSDGAPNVSKVSGDGVGKATAPVSSETSDRGMTIDQDELGSSFVLVEQLNLKTADKKEGSGPHVGYKDHADISPKSSETASMKISEIAGDVTEGSVKLERATAVENCEVEMVTRGLLEPSSDEDIGREVDSTEMSVPSLKHSEKENVTSQTTIPSADVHADKISSSDLSVSRVGDIDRKAESNSVSISENLETMSKNEKDGVECININTEPVQMLGSKDKPATDLDRSKSLTRGKKKRKEILQKADAAGSTSDLYMAYKGPEEKKDTVVTSESPRITSTSIKSKQVPTDSPHEVAAMSEEGEIGKAEPDDWEDAADISTPKLDPTANVEHAHGLSINVQDGNGYVAKKYSRDFLLKFVDKYTNLPENLEVAPDIVELFPNINSARPERDTHPSPRRLERQSTGPRLDRRVSNVADDDRWSKPSGTFGAGHDLRLDVSFGGNLGFRPGQGGVLRHPRAQTPNYAGGILSGPMQALGSQGGIVRNSDADRWQRGTAFPQKGLIPSPQTPLQMMHKAEKKYQVGKVADEEEVKQRQLKAILNKLTPQNFEKLFEQVKAVNIDNATTLTGLISQIFDKALMEPTFCEMYANLCSHLSQELPDFSEENEKITFRRVLLNKCQEEFERGEREQEEANKVEEGEIKQTEEEMEEKRIKARRRMLGNIRLIGELYKKRMLTEKIMHECMKKLLGQSQTPHEEDLEALCKLMSTIGEMIDHPKAKDHMDAYFERMTMLSNNMSISSRVRFMLKDAIELRKNKWQQRRKVEGPKKIEEVHRDAAQERQAQASRLARTPGINPSARRGMPMDFVSRGSTLLSSPSAQMGGFRGLSSQARAFGSQDIRFEERQPYEARTVSVPLPQRSAGDESITLGPQGGLGRGLSVRGPTSISSTLVGDISSGPVDSRRVAGGFNGFSSMERLGHNSRDDPSSRYMADRFSGPAPYDQWNVQDRTMQGSRDLRSPENSFDRSSATSPATRGQVPGAYFQNIPADKVWPEEKLRDMSLAAIKEFYSAEDEKEVALCIKDLNSPNFYPSMVSLWVTDSFERKDMERDLLAKLLINLTRSQDRLLNQVQLLKGFESVLATLEDAVNDAPKAPEFLGRIFAIVIIENVIPLWEIGQLLYEGGEEPGQLREIGLAADVLGNILEMIKLEKGETVLNEIRLNSNLRLEDFRPPDPIRSRILENFI